MPSVSIVDQGRACRIVWPNQMQLVRKQPHARYRPFRHGSEHIHSDIKDPSRRMEFVFVVDKFDRAISSICWHWIPSIHKTPKTIYELRTVSFEYMVTAHVRRLNYCFSRRLMFIVDTKLMPLKSIVIIKVKYIVKLLADSSRPVIHVDYTVAHSIHGRVFVVRSPNKPSIFYVLAWRAMQKRTSNLHF